MKSIHTSQKSANCKYFAKTRRNTLGTGKKQTDIEDSRIISKGGHYSTITRNKDVQRKVEARVAKKRG